MRCFVIMGGLSARMGTPKADLVFEGVTFRDRVLDTVRASFDEVIAVVRAGSDPVGGVETIFDEEHEGTSAIHGLLRALREAREEEKIFVVGIDFPLLTRELLSFLRTEFERSSRDLLVPLWEGTPQMLCGGYSQNLLSRVERHVARGEYRLRSLLSGDPEELLDEEIIRRRFPGAPLMNVNRPEDLELLRRVNAGA